jgi:hypothetical protein
MNDTGQTLGAIRVTYDGEQWRQAVNSTGAQQKLDFAYLIGSDPTLTSVGFIEVNDLDFTGPIPASTDSAMALNGNADENRVAGITQLVTGITWPPGQQLLLRWTELNDGNGNDNGHAVDNFSFFAEVAASLPGDFNGDGTVDAADYVVWRKNEGTTNMLLNDNGIGGTIGQAHHALWRTHFGQTAGTGARASANVTAPEPATCFMLLWALLGAWMLSSESPRAVQESLRGGTTQLTILFRNFGE